MVKAIHAGQATQHGLKAAILSSFGLQGVQNIFSTRKGFGEVFSLDFKEPELTLGLGKTFEIFNNGFKLYPSCASSHTAIDAVLMLREVHHLKPEDIEKIKVGSVQIVLDNLVFNNPENVTECRFSMPFCIALAMVDGKVTLENFSEKRLRDPRVANLIKKVFLYLDPEMASLGYKGTENASVTIITKDKKRFHKRVDIARGRALNPITEEELVRKFRICAFKALPEKQVDKILSILMNLDKSTDISEVFM